MWGISYCAIVAVLLCVAWAAPHDGDHAGHTEDHHHHLHHRRRRGPPPARTRPRGRRVLPQAGAPQRRLRLRPYRSLSKANTENMNIFFSPLGIATSLAMLSLGAKGDTHSQLYSTLGYGAFTPDQVNKAYEHLKPHVGPHWGGHAAGHGQCLGLEGRLQALAKFLEDAKHFYASEGFTVDFTNPAEAAAEINKFIAKKTQDKITDMVKDLDPDTAMVLINYVFFRGKWDKPFDATLTHKADFKVDENTKVQWT
ncbi:hypothetical protein J4Q44_G00322620 [Coregonus suidteri]|uniref:Serpin domain-containing protein n=1 Tax=Coregonus suidteri TaxID=861788 RepID=A0AAN8QAJ9_9TELE